VNFSSLLSLNAPLIRLTIVPKWRSDSFFKHIFNKYELLHIYPKGTFLFSGLCVKSSEFVPQGPTLFKVIIYLDDHTIEERSSFAHASAANYVYEHGIETKTKNCNTYEMRIRMATLHHSKL
jgi:hypothetical protein